MRLAKLVVPIKTLSSPVFENIPAWKDANVIRADYDYRTGIASLLLISKHLPELNLPLLSIDDIRSWENT